MASALFLLVLIVAALCLAFAERLDFHSFEPPFTEVDNSGQRQVSRNWRAAGTTVVNNNFVRLTPDRQSKKGSLWSRKPLGVPEFSAILKFRISGQGKTFFGDGLALWIVHQSYYSEGTLHGFEEKFVGIGIIFDTFKNTEHLAAHRDVTILVNDGEKTWEMMTENVQGCNINVRYHNDRADFSVTDASRAKVIADDNSVKVFIDAKNTGEWTECAVVKDLNLPREWTRKAFIGLTATTGQLADNHDVISLDSYSDHKVMEMELQEKSNKKAFEPATGSYDNRIAKLESAMNDLLGKQDYLDHHLEHEMASVSGHIDSMANKIKTREDKSEARIENLEEAVKKEVEGSLGGRLARLEQQMKASLDRRINSLENNIDRKINDKLDSDSKDSNNNNNNRPPSPAGRRGSARDRRDQNKVNANSDESSNANNAPCECSAWPSYLAVLVSLATVSFVYLRIKRNSGKML